MNTNLSTKTARIFEHLKKYGSITSWEAIEKYGVTRLSAIIFTLRKEHIIISSHLEGIDRYGDITRFVRYVYVGEKEDVECKTEETL